MNIINISELKFQVSWTQIFSGKAISKNSRRKTCVYMHVCAACANE